MKHFLSRVAPQRLDFRLRTYGVTAAIGLFTLSSAAPQCAPPPAVVQVTSVQDSVVAGVNRHRAQAGRGPVTVDSRLTVAAQGHSDHLARERLMTHVGAGWTNGGQRITSAGYSWTVWAENVAAGQSTPDEVVNAWMNSGGHRANILHNAVVHIGVAAAKDANGRTYWTMLVSAGR
jgi:uncharacterized protein YkwD